MSQAVDRMANQSYGRGSYPGIEPILQLIQEAIAANWRHNHLLKSLSPVCPIRLSLRQRGPIHNSVASYNRVGHAFLHKFQGNPKELPRYLSSIEEKSDFCPSTQKKASQGQFLYPSLTNTESRISLTGFRESRLLTLFTIKPQRLINRQGHKFRVRIKENTREKGCPSMERVQRLVSKCKESIWLLYLYRNKFRLLKTKKENLSD